MRGTSGSRHPDDLYEQEYGAAKALEQRRLYEEERACSCGSEHPKKWGTRWNHKPPCPRAGRKF